MGMSVLGTPETVSSLSVADVAAFAARNVTAPRVVVCAAGAVDAQAFASAASAAFAALPSGGAADAVEVKAAPANFTGSDKRLRFDSMPTAHVAFAFEGAAHGSSDVVPLMVMAAYLGSVQPGEAILSKNKTSKLAIDQGEQLAASSFKMINASYKDSGLFGIYLSAPDNRLEDAMWYSLWNLVRLVHKTSDEEVAFAKTQLKAKLVKDVSSSAGLAADLAKSIR